MISAFYRSKIHSTEDILTSCVFDAIRYSGEKTVLIDWLRKTETPDGGFPLSKISHNSRIEIKFWPYLNKEGCSSCEPDVMIEIEDQNKHFVLIEAKC